MKNRFLVAGYEKVVDLLPHDAPMVLIDDLIEWREDYVHTSVLVKEGMPFVEGGMLPSYITIEYMAQSIGVWRGMLSQQENIPPKIGFLLGARKLELERHLFKVGETLHIYGNLQCDIDNMASFECKVMVDGVQCAKAIVNVYQPDNAINFMYERKE